PLLAGARPNRSQLRAHPPVAENAGAHGASPEFYLAGVGLFLPNFSSQSAGACHPERRRREGSRRSFARARVARSLRMTCRPAALRKKEKKEEQKMYPASVEVAQRPVLFSSASG